MLLLLSLADYVQLLPLFAVFVLLLLLLLRMVVIIVVVELPRRVEVAPPPPIMKPPCVFGSEFVFHYALAQYSTRQVVVVEQYGVKRPPACFFTRL